MGSVVGFGVAVWACRSRSRRQSQGARPGLIGVYVSSRGLSGLWIRVGRAKSWLPRAYAVNKKSTLREPLH